MTKTSMIIGLATAAACRSPCRLRLSKAAWAAYDLQQNELQQVC